MSGADASFRLAGSGRALALARPWTRELAALPGDFLLLSALLLLTAAFGRPFSKLGIPSLHLYVTEVVLALVAVLALRRCGLRGTWERLRGFLPLTLLGLFLLAGAIATIRGLAAHGIGAITHDVGLAEYAVVLALVAVVVDTRAKADAFVRLLALSGLVATLVFAFVFFVIPDSRIGINDNALSAVGLYLALLVVLAAARAFHGVTLGRLELVAVGAALVLMSMITVRSVLLGLLLAACVLVALAPARRRLRAGVLAIAGLVLSLGGALALQSAGIGGLTSIAPTSSFSAVADPDYVADDRSSAFLGGDTVEGDASRGTASREVARGDVFELASLGGLDRGQAYTVVFAVRPLTPTRTTGRVGDTSGAGWSAVPWTTKPTTRWQEFRRTLTATGPSERLVLYVDSGAERVRVDAISVRRGVLPGAGAGSTDAGAAGTGPATVAPEDEPDARPGVVVAVEDSFGGEETGTGFDSNMRWRLAFWSFMAREGLERPILGHGFGRPSAFEWEGFVYDARTGDPRDPNDVTGPHNSFVNVFYRMGVIGLVALAGLVLVGVVRVVARLRRRLEPRERATLAGLLGLFLFACVITSFNVTLEGPFMGIFFWAILGGLYAAARFPGIGNNGEVDGA